MTQQTLKPISVIRSYNADSTDLNLINDDPSNPNDGTFITSLDPTGTWYIRTGFNNPSGQLLGDITLRVRQFNANITIGFTVYQNGTQIFTSNNSTVTEYTIARSVLIDPSGANLAVEFTGGKDPTGVNQSYLYAMDMVIDVVSSIVNPDTPINLSPSNGAIVGATILFSATLNDAEDPSVGDKVSLVVEYSQDQTLTSGITTLMSSPVTPSDTAYVVSQPMQNGTWYWRAKAVDSGSLESSYTEISSMVVANNAPNIPTNLSPIDGQYTSDIMPSFSATVSDVDGDNVKLVVDYSTSATFSSFTTIESNFVPSSYDVSFSTPTSLADNTTYYWRARAYDGIMYSDYSATRTLIVNNNPPSMPTSLSPANNTTVTVNNFTISATASDPENDTVQIEYQISNNINFSNILATSTVNLPFSYTYSNATQGNYYWRVRAKDSLGQYSNWTTPRAVYVNISMSGRLTLDTVIAQTNLTGATVANLSDDPDNPDTTFATATANTATMNIRVGFPTPPTTLKTGAGLQQFKAWVKRSYASATTSPTVTISVYENGVSKAVGTAITVGNSTGVLVSFTWDASVLTDKSGATVEFYMTGTMTGSGGARTTVSVGAIEWNYECVPTSQATAPNDTTAPQSVSNLSATTTTDSSVLSWNNPTDSDFSHVEIYRDNVLIKDLYTGTTYTDTGLTPNTQYTYKLISVDGSGNKSGQNTYIVSTKVDALPVPTVTIIGVSMSKISDEINKDRCTVTFSFDTNVMAWEVRVIGTGQGTGILADSGGSVASGTQIQAIIDYTELYQEGNNRVNIYGQNATGWTLYEG